MLPQLRFLPYKESPAWDVKSFGKLCVPVTDRAGTKKYILMSVTSGVGLIPQIEKFGREIAGNAYSSYYVIKKNDFAYNKSATQLFPEGYISMLTEYEEAALPNSIFTCFRIVDEGCVPQFFDHLFHNNYHGSWLRKYIEVGARAHGSLSVDTKHLWDMPVALPQIEEQQKIADCLSSLDDLIAAEDKKLEALKAHKKGLMQKLFPAEGETVPEWRFPEFRDDGEWEEKKITDIAKTSIGLVTTMTKNYVENGVRLIRNSDIKTNRINKDNLINLDVSFADENRNRKLQKFDIVTVHTGDIGVSAVIDDDMIGSIGFATLNTRPNKKIIDPYFLCWYFNSPRNINFAIKMATGDGRNNYNLRDFDNATVPFSSLGEQKKIADCLSSVDDLINEQAKKIEALKLHKKGLMQSLFPSIEEVDK